MRLTLHTDYALRTLIYLGIKAEEGVLVSIHDVAEIYGISENHLVKIIHRLGKNGFISTQRGRNGGICLAKEARAICIGDVVRVTEEETVLVACMQRDSKKAMCVLDGGCILKKALYKARQAFFEVLDTMTLADAITDHERRQVHRASVDYMLRKPMATT